MSSIRSRYPALNLVERDVITLTSQSLPRSLAGLGMDLFDLGVELSRAYQSNTPAPAIRPTFREPSFMVEESK